MAICRQGKILKQSCLTCILSAINENKVKIGALRAIPTFIDLLHDGKIRREMDNTNFFNLTM